MLRVCGLRGLGVLPAHLRAGRLIGPGPGGVVPWPSGQPLLQRFFCRIPWGMPRKQAQVTGPGSIRGLRRSTLLRWPRARSVPRSRLRLILATGAKPSTLRTPSMSRALTGSPVSTAGRCRSCSHAEASCRRGSRRAARRRTPGSRACALAASRQGHRHRSARPVRATPTDGPRGPCASLRRVVASQRVRSKEMVDRPVPGHG